MLRYAAIAALLALVACAHPAKASSPANVVVGAVAPIEVPRGPAVAAIAIGAKDSVDLTADGTMLEVRKETRIATKGTVFTVKKEREEGKFQCHIDYDTGPFDYEGGYLGEGISLVDAYGKAKVVIAKNEKEETDAMAIDEQASTLVGVVGSYLFLREDHVFFGCGAAHPMHGVEGFVWDAATGRKVDLIPPASAFQAALDELHDQGFEEESPRFVEAIPRFDTEGRLSIGWRFEKATSYADTEGDGSDYTKSIVVESSELPAPLAKYETPPPAIRNYLANGGEPIVGWSTLN